jgi:hypothetical protein
MDVTSVVLLEVDTQGIAFFEFECDTPRPIHVDRVARWLEASQRMKIETRRIHLIGPYRNIKTVESGEDTLMHLAVDPCSSALFPKLGKALAFGRSDHRFSNVS